MARTSKSSKAIAQAVRLAPGAYALGKATAIAGGRPDWMRAKGHLRVITGSPTDDALASAYAEGFEAGTRLSIWIGTLPVDAPATDVGELPGLGVDQGGSDGD